MFATSIAQQIAKIVYSFFTVRSKKQVSMVVVKKNAWMLLIFFCVFIKKIWETPFTWRIRPFSFSRLSCSVIFTTNKKTTIALFLFFSWQPINNITNCLPPLVVFGVCVCAGTYTAVRMFLVFVPPNKTFKLVLRFADDASSCYFPLCNSYVDGLYSGGGGGR